jgi:hypothetical protein
MVVRYAERHKLEDPHLPPSEVDNLLQPQLPAGILIRSLMDIALPACWDLSQSLSSSGGTH